MSVHFYLSDTTHKVIRAATVGGNIEAVSITFPRHDGLEGQQGICFDPAGNFYIADINGDQLFQVNPTTLAATVIAGTENGPLNGPALTAGIIPQQVCSDSVGNLYI